MRLQYIFTTDSIKPGTILRHIDTGKRIKYKRIFFEPTRSVYNRIKNCNWPLIMLILCSALVCMSLGVNLGRSEIERRTIEEMQIDLREDVVFIYHKGNVYEYDR